MLTAETKVFRLVQLLADIPDGFTHLMTVLLFLYF